MSHRPFYGKVFSLTLMLSGAGLCLLGLSDADAEPGITKTQLPASTLPGVVTKMLGAPEQVKRKDQTVAPPPAPASSLGPNAEKIKFTLTKITLEGNHVYPASVLSALYSEKLNREITVAELQDIVQNITNFYRNNGYILSRAILPPQHVMHGQVKVQVIEGYLDSVTVSGKPGRAAKIVNRYGQKAIQSKPLKLEVLEHYLYLMNDVPGVQARAVLQPSKTNVGAAGLELVTNRSFVTGSFSFDNYGTRYIGQPEAVGRLNFNSMLFSGDAVRLVYSTTPYRPRQLKFYDMSYSFLQGSEGLTLTGGKNVSTTHPGFTLAPTKVQGNATTYYMNAVYPLIKTRSQTLTIDADFNYLDSAVTSFGSLLYIDHIRSFRAGGTWLFADSLKGSNLLDLHAEQGTTLFGATHDIHTVFTSRYGGRGDFTKFTVNASRLQQIAGRFSGYFSLNGQYALNPLLASEQVAYGGSQIGRGYDPAEIIGDRGAGGSAEIRMDFYPQKYLLSSVEPFIFYDMAVIWNLKNVIGIDQKQSITSTGAGVRLGFNQYVSGSLLIAQPLTKQVAAEELVGYGRLPRIFFSLYLST